MGVLACAGSVDIAASVGTPVGATAAKYLDCGAEGTASNCQIERRRESREAPLVLRSSCLSNLHRQQPQSNGNQVALILVCSSQWLVHL